MRLSPWTTALTTLALACALPACQDDNQITGIPDTPPPTIPVSRIITAPATSPDTTPPTTAVKTAISPATTPAPTTTVDIHVEFKSIFNQFLADHLVCQDNPGACDPTVFLVAGSEFEQGYQERRQHRAQIGQYLVPGPNSHDEIQTVLTVGPGLVSGVVCGFDADIRMLADETPERTDDAIVDDTVGSYVVEYIFKKFDDRWRLQGYQQLSMVLGEDVCPAQ